MQNEKEPRKLQRPKIQWHHPNVGHRLTLSTVILAVDQPSSHYATWWPHNLPFMGTHNPYWHCYQDNRLTWSLPSSHVNIYSQTI